MFVCVSLGQRKTRYVPWHLCWSLIYRQAGHFFCISFFLVINTGKTSLPCTNPFQETVHTPRKERRTSSAMASSSRCSSSAELPLSGLLGMMTFPAAAAEKRKRQRGSSSISSSTYDEDSSSSSDSNSSTQASRTAISQQKRHQLQLQQSPQSRKRFKHTRIAETAKVVGGSSSVCTHVVDASSRSKVRCFHLPQANKKKDCSSSAGISNSSSSEAKKLALARCTEERKNFMVNKVYVDPAAAQQVPIHL